MARKIKQNKKETEAVEQVKKSIKQDNTKLGEQFKITNEDGEWTGQDIETKSDPLIDDGSGKETVLRRFDFSLPPNIPIEQLPTKEKLLEFHKSKVIAFLWKDELELIQEPKLVMAKDGRRFRIFALCQAKKGSLIYHKPKTLQEITNGQTNNTSPSTK